MKYIILASNTVDKPFIYNKHNLPTMFHHILTGKYEHWVYTLELVQLTMVSWALYYYCDTTLSQEF